MVTIDATIADLPSTTRAPANSLCRVTIESWEARVLAAPGAEDRVRVIEAELRRAVVDGPDAVSQGRCG